MRRHLPALLPLFLGLLLSLLLLPAAIAYGGPEKEFSKHGFKWKLPDGWAFGASSPDDVSAGFVAKAECDSASIEAWIYTKPTEGLSVDERVGDVKSNGAEGIGTVSQSKVISSSLSGVKGKAVVMDVRADGAKGHFRTYIISANGMFYQLILRCWHGSQDGEVAGINALRKGFRLLKGAGGEDKDEALDEFGKSGGDDEGSDDDGGGGDDDGTNGGSDPNWPRGGAKKEGRTVKLPTHNFEWTLPEGPFNWADAPTAEKEKTGRFVVATARVARKAKEEFEKDRPPSTCWVDVIIQDAPEGLRVNNWVRDGEGQKNVENWKMFDDINSGRTRTWEDQKVGNIKGALLKLEGKKGGRHTALLIFTATLRGKWYNFRAYAQGAPDVYKHMVKDIGAAVKGVKFYETGGLMRGPLLAWVPDYAWARGEYADKKKDYKSPGHTFTKPAGMAMIKRSSQRNRELKFAGEWRTEANDAYLYFEIRTYKLGQRGKPDPKPEKILNERAAQWSAGAGDEAYVGKKKGDVGRKGGLGKAKGMTYEFTGHLGDVPFTEEGFVVKHKRNLIHFIFQYGGVDGEKKLKKMIKAVKKGIKYSK